MFSWQHGNSTVVNKVVSCPAVCLDSNMFHQHCLCFRQFFSVYVVSIKEVKQKIKFKSKHFCQAHVNF